MRSASRQAVFACVAQFFLIGWLVKLTGHAMDDYASFLAAKAKLDPPTGLVDVPPMPAALFPFQRDITEWAIRRGRAAIFAGTGMGKSLMELSWARAIHEATDGNILLLAPLAVAAQMVREARKFGIEAKQVASQAECIHGINVTNYQKLGHFDLTQFVGVVLDEASILKSTDGHYRTMLIRECKCIPFRLVATATPSPNDYMELGSYSEFLSVMDYTDMLAMFFSHDGGETQKWRLKGHGEDDFWRWMASWAVMLRRPSDMGYPDGAYKLPTLHQHQHVVRVDYAPSLETGTLFPVEARTMRERIGARKDSVKDRVKLAAAMTPTAEPVVWWCNLNSESAALAKAIKGAVEVSGSDTEESKEQKLIDFVDGKYMVLVSKPSIAGYGMNFQHCAWTGFVGLSDSFEQVYQAVRRFWRFGQTREVHAHFIAAETEGAVIANLRRKEADADRMVDAMVAHMADLTAQSLKGSVRTQSKYNPTQPMIIPAWLRRAA